MAALLCMSCLRQEEEEVTELDYRHCSLDDVPNEIFAYERTLETLRLDSNNIRDLPRLAKRHITGSLKFPPCVACEVVWQSDELITTIHKSLLVSRCRLHG